MQLEAFQGAVLRYRALFTLEPLQPLLGRRCPRVLGTQRAARARVPVLAPARAARAQKSI